MKSVRRHLDAIKYAGLYRTRNLCDSKTHTHRIINRREVVSFCSNDYLGLASDPRVVRALQKGAEDFGVGSGASYLINGYTRAHEALETKLATLTGRDRALLFSTGFMANLGVIHALVRRGEAVLQDRLSHASLIDGAQLAQAKLKRYAHGDPTALDALLVGTTGTFVATDTVFSMDGDIAPLIELADVCGKHQAVLLVDDAHGFGIFGNNGSGTVAQHRLNQTQVPILIGTFGKACGTFGAFVAGDEALIETLVQQARTYIYTTALPAAVACATLRSLEIIAAEPERREWLHENITLFRQCAADADLPTHSQTAIQPIIVHDARLAVAISSALFNDGIQVSAIRPPTVAEGMARLRITLSSQHTKQDIRRLVQSLALHYRNFVTKTTTHPNKHSIT